MNTVFQFNTKPQYKKSTIDYKQAYLGNILKSFYLNKVRFLTKLYKYKQQKKSIKVKSISDLNSVTQLSRPGTLFKK